MIYAGRAGTGLSEADMKELEGKAAGLQRMEPPFQLAPKPRAKEKITWLEPELVAEIKFAEWTKDHLLRQVSFKGLPITWAELDTVAPAGVNKAEALRRIGGNDPWQDFFRNNQLTSCINL